MPSADVGLVGVESGSARPGRPAPPVAAGVRIASTSCRHVRAAFGVVGCSAQPCRARRLLPRDIELRVRWRRACRTGRGLVYDPRRAAAVAVDLGDPTRWPFRPCARTLRVDDASLRLVLRPHLEHTHRPPQTVPASLPRRSRLAGRGGGVKQNRRCLMRVPPYSMAQFVARM